MSLFDGIRPGGLFGEGGGRMIAPLPDYAGMAARSAAAMPGIAASASPAPVFLSRPPSGSDVAQDLARAGASLDGSKGGAGQITAAMRDAREKFAQRQIDALIDGDPGLASPQARAFARQVPVDYLNAAIVRGRMVSGTGPNATQVGNAVGQDAPSLVN
jgi:hypothetical protein